MNLVFPGLKIQTWGTQFRRDCGVQQPQVPFASAQGRLSTKVTAATFAQGDSFMQ
jgi:hypothetical protein